jgi:hypothetical protein
MWDDQPVQRTAPLVDMPPSTRAFLSQFNRSFTPPALINDPYAVDRKLVITPLLLGRGPLCISRNPFAVDPAIERVRHYVGCEEFTDPDLRPSPTLPPVQDDEWASEDEENFTSENKETAVVRYLALLIQIYDNGKSKPSRASSHGNATFGKKANGNTKGVLSNGLDFIKPLDVGMLPQSLRGPPKVLPAYASKQTPASPKMKGRVQPRGKWDSESDTEPADKEYVIAVSTPPTRHDMLPHIAIGSPAQSDVPTMTSWDEWDGPSESLWRCDPMVMTSDGLVVHYDSLL